MSPTSVSDALDLYRRTMEVLQKVLPQMKNMEPMEALHIVREENPWVAANITDHPHRDDILQRLTQKKLRREREKMPTLPRDIALELGARIFEASKATFERFVDTSSPVKSKRQLTQRRRTRT